MSRSLTVKPLSPVVYLFRVILASQACGITCMGEANVNNCVLFFQQRIIMGDDLNRTFGVVAGADFTISLGC